MAEGVDLKSIQCEFESHHGHVTFSENSTDDDFDWSIELVVDDKVNSEIQVEVGGYKYPLPGGTQEPFSNYNIDCYLTIGHRWGSYGNISVESPEKLDQIIMALQTARDKFFDLSLEFPRKEFSLEEYQNRINNA